MRKLLILLGITVCLMSATPVVTDQKRVLWEDLDTIYMLAGKGRYDTAMIMANNLLPIAIEHHQRQVVVLLLNTIGTGYRYRDMDEQALKVFKLAEDCINELSLPVKRKRRTILMSGEWYSRLLAVSYLSMERQKRRSAILNQAIRKPSPLIALAMHL